MRTGLRAAKGSDPNSRNSKANGQTPMHAAAEKGCVATLMALREVMSLYDHDVLCSR